MSAALADFASRLQKGGIDYTDLDIGMEAPSHAFVRGQSVVLSEEQRAGMVRTPLILVKLGLTVDDAVLDKWLAETQAETKEAYDFDYRLSA